MKVENLLCLYKIILVCALDWPWSLWILSTTYSLKDLPSPFSNGLTILNLGNHNGAGRSHLLIPVSSDGSGTRGDWTSRPLLDYRHLDLDTLTADGERLTQGPYVHSFRTQPVLGDRKFFTSLSWTLILRLKLPVTVVLTEDPRFKQGFDPYLFQTSFLFFVLNYYNRERRERK